MRFCGGFRRFDELCCPKQRNQPGRAAGESVGSTLLAVDNADDRPALQTGLPERPESRRGGAAGGDDVLDQADELTRLERPFEPVARPVVLRLLADDDER